MTNQQAQWTFNALCGKPGKYRFFYHYFKAKKCMSVHWRDKCYTCNYVICKVPCSTKWNKRQPNLVMQGYANKLSWAGTETLVIS